MIVVVEPWCHGLGALVVACEYLPAGPFGLEGPAEAFDLAVLPRAVRFDQDEVDSIVGEGLDCPGEERRTHGALLVR